jgi:hypothetical protein
VNEDAERIAALQRDAEAERVALAIAIDDIREEVERRRTQFKILTALAGGAAALGTVGWKLFGSKSPAARIGKAASVVSVGLGLARVLVRLRRFL